MTMTTPHDTIFALSSAPGRGGVAVLRVSGPGAARGLLNLSRRKTLPPSHKASLIKLIDNVSRETLDHALVIYFAAPASFTGEDVVEYHVHGGPAVINSVLEALSHQPAHRMATPGEFTRRAFENGKMDLTEAEAVADLIHAETHAQKLQALSQMEGGLSAIYEGWTERLKNTLAHLEADIEFPDEDLPEGITPEITDAIGKLLSELTAHLSDNRRGERLRDGLRLAIIGAPNAGKSTLINALTRRDIAIVSDIAGTTRDVIEAHLDLGGYPVIIADTAGLRPDQIDATDHDKIESEGIRRALDRAKNADLKILLFDATQETPDTHTLNLLDDAALLVINKVDCHPEALALKDLLSELSSRRKPGSRATNDQIPDQVRDDEKGRNDIICISAKSGAGLTALESALIARIETLLGSRETPSLTRRRHREALEDARQSLTRASSAPLPELLAEDLRLATRALGRITGRVDVEDLLDVIFRDFCIGK